MTTHMHTPVLHVEKSDNIVTITLNRPSSLNALNLELLSTLVDTLQKYHNNARAIILQGAGERAFCAGEDLKETLAPKTRSAEEYSAAFALLQDVTRYMTTSSAIIVAAVEGYAVGGGAEMALAADYVIGSPRTRFQFPEVKLGHAVTGAISQRLAATVGILRAKEMFLSGRMISSEEALRVGMLTECVEEPKTRAREFAAAIASTPGVSAGALKLQVESACFPSQEAVLQAEVKTANYCYSAVDAQDSYGKFAERSKKRKYEAISDLDAITTINQALSRALDRWPDAVFLRMDGKDTSFREFDKQVELIAALLQTSFNIHSGDRVMTMMKNSREAVLAWFAINRLGAIYVPLNNGFRSMTLTNAVQLAQASAAFVDADLLAIFRAVGVMKDASIIVNDVGFTALDPDTNGMSLLSQNSKTVNSPVLKPSEVDISTTAALLYTSGTTGRSKACILSHGYFVESARALIKNYGINNSDVLYCPFPLYHIDATALTITPALLLGATAAIGRKFSVSRFWEDIRQTKATVYDFMGTTLSLVYKNLPDKNDRNHNVRFAWGVPVPAWAKEYEHRFGHKIVELYGSTESGLPIMQQGERVLGSCGRVIEGYEVKIVNLSEGISDVGEIWVRAKDKHKMFDGYYENPEATRTNITQDDWFRTGDLGTIEKNGDVYFRGRLVDCVRRKGENISSMEVEEEILTCESVREVAVIGIPSVLGEQDLKVIVVVKDDSDEEKIWTWCVNNLSRVHVPDVVEVAKQMSRTSTGKVMKSALSASGGRRFDSRQTNINNVV